MKEHISYSEMKMWAECPRKHKLVYLDKISLFKGNEFTAFGQAVHSTCENLLLNENLDKEKHFMESFLEQTNQLQKEDLDNDLIESMKEQGRNISKFVLPAVKSYFGDYEVLSTEEMLYVPIDGYDDIYFKGYIDLVLKDKNGKIHIVDWKTCSWGWDSSKKTNKLINYQLTLYKYFYAKKHNIEKLKDIEVHFALLKRTAKKNNVEIFRSTSGDRRIKNSLKLLNNALYNIKKKVSIPNRLSCQYCEFYKTEHCK